MLGWVPRWLRWAFALLVLVLVAWFLVVPQMGEAERALGAIRRVHVGWVLAGTVLVVASVAAQAQLTRSVLPEGERPGLAVAARMELATMAVAHTVPGGSAAGTALAYRLLTRAGVGPSATGFALGIRGIGSALVLNLLLWAALVISIPTQGFDGRYTTAALIAAVLLGLVGVAVVGLLRTPATTARTLCRVTQPVPFVDHDRVPAVVERLARQLRDLVADRRLALRAVGWAVAYWVTLAASLWVLLHAFGWAGDPISVLVAFGLVNVLAALPVTPKGLGVLEAVLIPMLIGFGAPAGVATVGVISWRLLSFWAPIPLGTLSYVSLRLARPGVRPEQREEVARELGATAAAEREGLGEWAERHALRRPG